MDTRTHIPFHLCARREPHPQACTPPGFEWLPGYLGQYGGQLTDYGRNWLLNKWDEPYRAALETSEREYQACLEGGVTDVQPKTGLQLRVASRLDAGPIRTQAAPNGALASRLDVHFTPTGGGPVPCDPFDPEHQPGTPVDVPASVPLSVFWTGVTASYDLEALKQAMQPVNANLNPDNPLSLRDLRLDTNGVQSAVRIAGHGFLPIPANVVTYDDLGIDLQVASIRLDFSAEWAASGAVLDEWSAISTSEANPDAYTDFYCYYLGCPWWTPPPPVFDWNLVPPGCLEDITIRALPTAVTVVRVSAGTGEPLGESVLSISNVGTIASRPVVARHRIFNSPGTPHQVLPLVEVGPAALGETLEVAVALPACVVGKVELAPDTIQDYNLVQQDGYLGVLALPGATSDAIKLRLTRLRNLYHWDRDVDVRFIPIGGVDVGHPPSGWFPHLILRVPVSWSGCDTFRPDTDSLAQAVIVGWSATDTYTAPPRWLHRLELRVTEYAAPCDAFDCVWGYMKVTWPNGTQQTQQIMCVAGDIDRSRVFTLKLDGNAPPTVNVELTLYYESVNRRRQVDGTDFDYLTVPGNPAIRIQTLTP